MRLSNLFIYGSVAIIVASSLGFLIFKAIPGNQQETDRLAQRIKTLQREKEDLRTESGETSQRLTDKITSLSDDLQRASRLITDKDEEIHSLRQQLAAPDEKVIQLARRLNCQPAQVLPAVQQMLANYQSLQRQLQSAQQQLAQLKNAEMGTGGPEDTAADRIPVSDPNQGADRLATDREGGNQPATALEPSNLRSRSDAPPRIKKLELAGPQNRDRSVSPEPKTGAEQGAVNPAPRRQPAGDARSNAAATPQISATRFRQLQQQIEQLQAELQNREKLLYEQTSLIEDLKEKSRIETGLRSGENVISGTPTRLPFRDRGTFPIRDR